MIYYVNITGDYYHWFFDYNKAENLAKKLSSFVRIYDPQTKLYTDKFLTM